MITYQLDDYKNSLPELMLIYPAHYEEVAADKDIVKLDPDYEQYMKMYEIGILQMVSARDDGKLIGYVISMVMPHLHYKQSLTCYPDIMFLKKDYRKGRNGIKLIQQHIQACRDKKVQRVYFGAKLSLDFSPILERLGFKPIETLHTMILEYP